MQSTIDALDRHGLERETADLSAFYRDVRTRVRGLTDSAARQDVIKELYGRFIKEALPDAAESLGIAYTPVPVVDYVIRSVEDVLKAEFGASISDPGVHVIDPFVGTGTFITRLIQSGLIGSDDLPRKYQDELHANEMLLLAYYIAAVNIETAYHDAIADTSTQNYRPFEGIVLTDTFEMSESSKPMDNALFPYNNRRIERQKGLDIRVVIGNPPWSANENRDYPTVDQRVRETYADTSVARLSSALYDPYVKAIRQASDRVLGSEQGGIVAFVTNGGFIDNKSFDGFRKAVAQEFDAIYCYNLRGDQRTAGEKSREEGGKIFGSDSRASVAVLLLVKKPGESHGAKLYYNDIGDYLKREEKPQSMQTGTLEILDNTSLATTEWQSIRPNAQGDWVNQRSEVFPSLRPLATQNGEVGGMASVFLSESVGLVSRRDAWVWNSSDKTLRHNVERAVEFYQKTLREFAKIGVSGKQKERADKAKQFVGETPSNFHWNRDSYRDLGNCEEYQVDPSGFTVGVYRPFFRQRLYFNDLLNSETGKLFQIFPEASSENVGLALSGTGVNAPFYALMTEAIVDDGFTGHSAYFPRWCYRQREEALGNSDVLEQVSNINPCGLAEYREYYGEQSISEDDLFYHVYGILHSREYRETFAADLGKSAPRIPMPETLDDFCAFVRAGRKLSRLHNEYENIEPHDLDVQVALGWDLEAPDAYRVVKMSYASKTDKTRIRYNAGITIAGIPEEAQIYQLGSRSALDWLIDRYQVSTHKDSGIVNDPNDWCEETGDRRYILDLIGRIVTVSLETNRIVETLPELRLGAGAARI